MSSSSLTMIALAITLLAPGEALGSPPDSVTINCRVCKKQSFSFDRGLGPTYVDVLGAVRDSCLIRYQINLEMGVGPKITCHVPRRVGTVRLARTEEGIDFSPLTPFIREVREGGCLPIPTNPDSDFYVPVDELPRAIKSVTPDYPDSGRGAEGTVVLRVLIGRDGRVKDVVVTRSLSGFDEAAKSALRQWVFAPALKEGKPVPVWVVIPVRFKPPEK